MTPLSRLSIMAHWFTHYFSRRFALWPLLLATVFAGGCASSPSNISLIPGDQITSETEKEGLFTQPVDWEKTAPACSGECPEIKVNSLVFPGEPMLTELVDHALAMMTGIDPDNPPGYTTIEGFESYFWKTAGARDKVFLNAKTRYRNRHLTVIELGSGQYFTGAAHGISATQFLNWNNAGRKVLGIHNVLRQNEHDSYVVALKRAHEQWLTTQSGFQENPEQYRRLWPFQPSDNFALTDMGLVVKYDSYALAPYSSGQPELLIPYNELNGILKPEFIPANSARLSTATR